MHVFARICIPERWNPRLARPQSIYTYIYISGSEWISWMNLRVNFFRATIMNISEWRYEGSSSEFGACIYTSRAIISRVPDTANLSRMRSNVSSYSWSLRNFAMWQFSGVILRLYSQQRPEGHAQLWSASYWNLPTIIARCCIPGQTQIASCITDRRAAEPSLAIIVARSRADRKRGVASIVGLARQSVNYDRPVAYITRRRYPH